MIDTNPEQWMWEQKYRPTTLDQCILPEQDLAEFKGAIKSGRLAHTLLYSKQPGTGKTTMARVLCNEIDAEVLFISGGKLRIDHLRNDLTEFATTMTSKPGGKVIIIDEADNKGMRPVQEELRSWMEAYSHNCSVIMTCNHVEAITPHLRSRCNRIEFGNPTDADKVRMMREMIKRCVIMCQSENVVIEDMKAIAALVKKHFPDFRSVVTELSGYAACGKIDTGVLTHTNQATQDLNDLIVMLRNKKLGEVRALVPKFTLDYNGFVTKLYDRLIKEVEPTSIRMMIKYIAENQKYANNIPNMEIHLFDLMADLSVEMRWK